jgi:hypothetical protein
MPLTVHSTRLSCFGRQDPGPPPVETIASRIGKIMLG